MNFTVFFIAGMLALIVVVSEFLVRKTWLKRLGTALLVILITAVVANLGIIPTGAETEKSQTVYQFTFSTLAPLSILWLLLQVNLKEILKAGIPIIMLFLVGSVGTALGIVIGIKVINGPETIGPLYNAIAGMLTGTYTGGSINFNAVALHYNVMEEGVLFAGTTVVDNIITTIWMILTIAIPNALRTIWPHKQGDKGKREIDLGLKEDTESLHPMDLGMSLFVGFSALALSEWITFRLDVVGINIPAIIILTILALILAQFKFINKMRGPRLLGLFSVYLFLAVIGAFCDFEALANIGSLGVNLLFLAFIAILIHGILIFGVARIFKMDIDIAAVASQANVGGGTSALALARSLGRKDLILAAVLIGSLGNALGTFLGFWVAGFV